MFSYSGFEVCNIWWLKKNYWLLIVLIIIIIIIISFSRSSCSSIINQ